MFRVEIKEADIYFNKLKIGTITPNICPEFFGDTYTVDKQFPYLAKVGFPTNGNKEVSKESFLIAEQWLKNQFLSFIQEINTPSDSHTDNNKEALS